MLSPVEELSEANRKVLCKSATVLPIPPSKRLQASEEHRWLTYLIEGQVAIMEDKTQKAVLTDDSQLAKTPLFSSANPHQWAMAKTASTILRFDREQAELLLKEQQRNATQVIEIQVSEADNKVFDAVYEAFQKRRLAVPSIPDIALKVREAVNKDDVSAGEVAQIIQADPVLTGRIINIANSPVARGVEKVQTLKMAVMRLGLEATRNLAFTLAVKQLFESKNQMIGERMTSLFARSGYIAALSYVLAKRIDGIDNERAQLAGLIHDIGGIPILHYAENYPDLFSSPDQLQATVDNLGQIVGHWVLSEWEFDHELCDIPQNCRDWYRSKATDLDYSDIVTAALLYEASADETHSNTGDIPALASVAIGRKLVEHGIDLSGDSNFFVEATDEISLVNGLIG